MIVDFLSKLHSELIEEKLELESDISRSTISLDENLKYIEKLKTEDDINFDAFSPRKQNVALRENIKCLEDEYHELSNNLKLLNERLIHVNTKIEEVNLILKTAKKQKSDLKCKDEFSTGELHDFCVEKFTSIEHKIKLCSTLFDIDPGRCKLELQAVSGFVLDVLEQMEKNVL